MKTLGKIILACMLCTLCLMRANAQGLSLSFNLTETDTLANMIADSKKYEISSLTIKGFINATNIKYILDLNENGNLRYLDMSNASHVSTYHIHKVKQTFYDPVTYGRITGDWSKKYSHYNEDGKELFSYISDFGFKSIPGGCNYTSHNGINSSRPVYITITKEYTENQIIITIDAGYSCPYGDGVHGSNTISINYTKQNPRIIFQDNSFSRFLIPDNITSVGGNDCRFRLKECNEYVMGKQLSIIDENAFKGSHIETMTTSSSIKEIHNGAFENAKGNIDPSFVEGATYIGDNAFKNSSCLNKASDRLYLKANRIGYSAFQNAILPDRIYLQNVEEIGENAFMGANIKGIEIGNNCNVLPDSVFANCLDLLYMKGGQNVEWIGDYAFGGCKMLKDFSPSNSLRSIGCYAFANTKALSTFRVPLSTKSIGIRAFEDSGIKELDLDKFDTFRRSIIIGCDSLEILQTNDNNEYLKSENGILYTKDESKIIAYPNAKKDAIFTIPNNITEISDSAFYEVNKLRALVIPESVKSIGEYNQEIKGEANVVAIPVNG